MMCRFIQGQVSSIKAYDDMYKSGGHPSFLHDDSQLESKESSCLTFPEDLLLQNHTYEEIAKQQTDQIDGIEESQMIVELKEVKTVSFIYQFTCYLKATKIPLL